MIIGICGTHGTGKSTILNSIKQAGYDVDESQLSRTAQKLLGWDKLSRAEESIENMWALQDAILQSMYDRDTRILESGKLTIVERTPADAWAYTSLWLSRLVDRYPNEVNSSMNEARELFYKAQCRHKANEYAKFIVVPPSPDVRFVEEPNRADGKSRTFVECRINEFLSSGNLPTSIIQFTSKEQRSAEAQAIICLTKSQLLSKKESQ